MAQNKRLVLGLFITLMIVIGLGIFIFFNSRIFIAGPQITVLEPKNGYVFDNPFINIVGIAKNTAHISINDHPIFIDENGNFNEKLLLSPGVSIIEFYARDKFNREISFTYEYYYGGEMVSPNSNEDLIEISTSSEETSD